jgi:hypothetical protein
MPSKNKSDSRCDSYDGYTLMVINDTPYHEGAEYWFRNDIGELIEIAQDNWDWMGTRETYIFKFRYGETFESIDNILPSPEDFDEENEEWGDVDVLKYPVIETDDTYVDIYVCDKCMIFQKGDNECRICHHTIELTT